LSEHSVLKKFSQNPDAEALHKYLTGNYPGASYHLVYEAGFCVFWIHRRLVEFGINNIVVNPADVPTKGKEKLQKTDAADCGKLARELRSKSLTGIYVPDEAVLEMRSLIR
jgi:transposase